MSEITLKVGENTEGFSANEITADDFRLWKDLTVTKYIHGIIKTFRDELANNLCCGGTLISGQEAIIETSKVVGILYGADLFLEANYEEKEE